MITARTLILGSAAGLMALSGAQAADLPVKAKAVEYVRICSLYGAGFFYIPGTDTCIKLGGYLRADVTFNGGAHGAPAWNGDLGQRNRYRDYYVARSRMALTVDTRTATEYGVVRTFGQGDFQFNNLGGSTANPTRFTALPGVNANLLYTAGGGYVAVEYLFIQFAGFTFGKSASAYCDALEGFPGNINSSLLGGNNTDTGVNNIQYTAEFGNGVSASIGLDDPTVWDRTSVYNLASPARSAPTAPARTPMPARMRPTSSATSASIRPGVCSSSRPPRMRSTLPTTRWARAPSRPNLSEITGHPETKWGGSVMAALQIKNIPTGAGDDIKVDVVLRQGRHQVRDRHQRHLAELCDVRRQWLRAYQSVGFGATTDGVYLPGAGGTGGIALTSAWGIRGAFNHNWDPYWSSSLFGSYSAVRYDGGANDNLRVREPPRPRAPTARPSRPATRARRWPATLSATTPATPTSTSRSSAPTSAGHPSRT